MRISKQWKPTWRFWSAFKSRLNEKSTFKSHINQIESATVLLLGKLLEIVLCSKEVYTTSSWYAHELFVLVQRDFVPTVQRIPTKYAFSSYGMLKS